jgi:hypothetical protein
MHTVIAPVNVPKCVKAYAMLRLGMKGIPAIVAKEIVSSLIYKVSTKKEAAKIMTRLRRNGLRPMFIQG